MKIITDDFELSKIQFFNYTVSLESSSMDLFAELLVSNLINDNVKINLWIKRNNSNFKNKINVN